MQLESPLTEVVAPRSSRLSLIHPTRSYAVTRNPFAVSAVLPLIVLAFVGLGVALAVGLDWTLSTAGFVMVTLGLLLIPALTLRGHLTLTHDGVTFVRGREFINGSWERTRLMLRNGICIEIMDPDMNTTKINSPGGLDAVRNKRAVIPLRMFGDRYYSILYDIRERLPENLWHDALNKASRRGGAKTTATYAIVTLLCCVAMIAALYIVTHP